jgi:hypothetical protein
LEDSRPHGASFTNQDDSAADFAILLNLSVLVVESLDGSDVSEDFLTDLRQLRFLL